MKYFQVSAERAPKVDKDVLLGIEADKQARTRSVIQHIKDLQQAFPLPDLTHTDGRVLLRVNPQQKNFHTFSDGQEIALERDVNNMDRAYTQQVLGECISADGIPKGALVLFHFNALHDVNTVFDLSGQLSGEEIATGILVLSVPQAECFLWNAGDGWQAVYPFVLIERVFEPYRGLLLGVEPKEIPNTFYVKSGELCGQVVRTLAHSGYRIIFRNEQGVDETFLRCRHYRDSDLPAYTGEGNAKKEEADSRQEIIAIDHEATARLQKGDLLVGITAKDAKSIQ